MSDQLGMIDRIVWNFESVYALFVDLIALSGLCRINTVSNCESYARCNVALLFL